MITNWLKKFQENWINKNIDNVLDLFCDNVEYFETPTQLLKNKTEIQKSWMGIQNHEIEKLDLEIKVRDKKNQKFAVEWRYLRSGVEWRGLYIIHLDKAGLCSYFYSVGNQI